MPKTDLVDEGVGAIHYGQIYTRYGVSAKETISFVSPETATRLASAHPGDIIITNTSENLEDVGKAVAWLGDQPVVTGGHATIIKHHEDPKFLAYWFESSAFFAQKKALATGTKVIDVSARQLAKVQVPVPPLDVQREIVRVLDLLDSATTDLAAVLVTEMEARRVQYAHYREALLSFAGTKVERMPLGQMGDFIRGRRFVKADVAKDGIPAIHYGEIYTHYGTSTYSTITHIRADLAGRLRYAQPGDVVIAAVGETVGDVAKAVAWLGSGPVAIHDDTFLFRSRLDPKYVSYFMQTANFHSQKNKHVARAKMKRLSGESLAKILIPVPSLTNQRRIVDILDRLEVAVKDFLVDLPAEAEYRRKQYEYYRDRLLTFEELVDE